MLTVPLQTLIVTVTVPMPGEATLCPLPLTVEQTGGGGRVPGHALSKSRRLVP